MAALVIPDYYEADADTFVPVTAIGAVGDTTANAAFYNNTGITSVYIPASVTTIGIAAFTNLDLRTVRCQGTTPPNLAAPINVYAIQNVGVFDTSTGGGNINAGLSISVPAASLNAYRTAPNWDKYANRISGN